MNNGKICISVCAETVDELFEKITRAEPLADVIEIRFDCLELAEIDNAISNLPQIEKTYLFTYRPAEQGGKRALTLDDRIQFWLNLIPKIQNLHKFLIDYEFDIDFKMNLRNDVALVSTHYFKDMPADIAEIYEFLSRFGNKPKKIAAMSHTITDSLCVWKLLEKAHKTNQQIIPIAMGEPGKWTRILGLAHGSFMTYSALDAGGATAPGQITAEDMIDVFRVKKLDKTTEVFGIIAGDTTYSLSPYIHNSAFKTAGMNRVFVPLQVADLGEFMRRMIKIETREIDLNFHGFSVTNPHKQTIIPFLDELDKTAQIIGAVNTVKIVDGKLFGSNTDASGFIEPLIGTFGDVKNANVAVFGSGGAARACIYSLKQNGADVTIFARDAVKRSALAKEFGIQHMPLPIENKQVTADILVNSTPLGTKGQAENETIATAEQLINVKLIYDLIYNPEQTRLIREAKIAGCKTLGGLDMLIGQAVRQFEIWTGEMPSLEIMKAAVRKRLSQ